MKIAELFVNLGLVGGEDTNRDIKKVKDSLGNVSTSGLQAKAALIGVMYGLHRFASQSIGMGKELNNFSILTGISSKTLQQWQHVARGVGVEAGEVSSAFKNVQSTFTNMMLTGQRPQAWGMFMQAVQPDVKKLRDTEYMMRKLQEFAQKMPADVGRNFLSQFGLSEGVITAMRQGAFNNSALSKAPIYSNDQVKKLKDISLEWDKMMIKADKLAGDLTAKFGGQFIEDISNLADKVFRLSESLATLADKWKVFEWVGKIAEGWTHLFDFLGQTTDDLNHDKTSKDSYKKGSRMYEFMRKAEEEVKTMERNDQMRSLQSRINSKYQRPSSTVIHSKPNVNVTVTGNADPSEVAKSAERGVSKGNQESLNQVISNIKSPVQK